MFYWMYNKIDAAASWSNICGSLLLVAHGLLLRAVSAQHPRRKGAHVKYSDLIEISGFNINGRIQPRYHVTILDCVIQSKAKKRKPENSRLPRGASFSAKLGERVVTQKFTGE